MATRTLLEPDADSGDGRGGSTRSEAYVFSQQNAQQELLKEYDTKIIAWSPLAQGRPDIHTTPY